VPSRRQVRLVDGTQITVRPVQPDDKRCLLEVFHRLSAESRYRRFHSAAATLDGPTLAYLTEVDHHSHEALVAVDPADDTIVGVARFVALEREPGVGEMAIVVVDGWQHRGVGTALLALLIDRARDEGLHAFDAFVLAENRPMLAVLDEFGTPVRRGREGATTELLLELPSGRLGDRLPDMLAAAAKGELHIREDMR
jgi:GNAT superfamily N-acetyltransferase